MEKDLGSNRERGRQRGRVCLESDFRQSRIEWLKEHLQHSNDTRIECTEVKQRLHQAFGYTSDPELGHSVRGAFPDVSHKRIRVGGRKQRYFYCGIKWAESAVSSAVLQDAPLKEAESRVAVGNILKHSHDNDNCGNSIITATACGSPQSPTSIDSPYSYLPPFADSPRHGSVSTGISSTSRNTTTTLEGQKCYIPDYGMDALRMKNLQRKVITLHGQVQMFFDSTTSCIIIDKQVLSKGLILGETVDDIIDKLKEKNVPIIDVDDLSPIRRLEFD